MAHRLFIKGMTDMADSQLSSGLVPNIAPEYVEFPGTFRAAAEWGAAAVLVPWQHYQATGDAGLLAEHYAVMQKYLDYLGSKAVDGIVNEGLGDWYDLGPADRPGHAQLTPPPVTATAFYFLCADRLSRISGLLGKPEEARRYTQLAEGIKAAWRREFRNAEGSYATGSQCSLAIALVMGLAEDRDRDKALAALVEDLRSRGDAMTAGDVGFRYLLQALSAGGRSDVVYDMINQSDRPGYGYQLARGATSLTEAWDANHFASHNHFMLGHITEWFYKDLVGISSDPTGPGYRKIIVRPEPVDGLEWAEATHTTVRGPVRVRWDRAGNTFHLAVTIPANTTATVNVPVVKNQRITESDNAIAEAAGVQSLGYLDGRARFRIQSGSYTFSVE